MTADEDHGPVRAVASVEAIRARFPALERRHAGHPVAYFDGPGGTQVPRDVVEAMADYLIRHNANTHWHYPTSEETDRLIAEARQAVADFLNGGAAEVAFGANMTTLTFHLARALGRGWGPGDEIVVTELDHHANVAPWRALEQERGVRVRVVPFRPETGQLDWPALERALGPRTRLLAIGGASNALGTVNDVVAAAAAARGVGALTFMDAVHYAPHALVDVRALGVDFLACSAYKFYGPHVGILWGRAELLEALDVPKLEPAPSRIPDKLETGTQNHEGIAGVLAAVEFFAALAPAAGSRRERLGSAFAVLHRRGEELFRRLWDGLTRTPGCAASVLLRVSRGRRRCRSRSRAARPRTSPGPAPRGACSFPMAISTRRRYWSGWVTPGTGWCGPGAPATRPRRKWTAWWRRWEGAERLLPQRDPHPRLLPLQHQGGGVARRRLRPDGEHLDRGGQSLRLDPGPPDLLGLYRIGIVGLLAPLRDRPIHDHLPLARAGHGVERIAARRNSDPRDRERPGGVDHRRLVGARPPDLAEGDGLAPQHVAAPERRPSVAHLDGGAAHRERRRIERALPRSEGKLSRIHRDAGVGGGAGGRTAQRERNREEGQHRGRSSDGVMRGRAR